MQQLESQLSSAASTTVGQTSEDVVKLRQELAAAQKEAEDMRTRADIMNSFGGSNAEGGAKLISDQVAEKVAAIKSDLDAQFDKRVEAASEAATTEKLRDRSNKMKDKLNAQLKQGRLENEEALQKLKSEHQAELDRIRQENRAPAPPNDESAPKDADTDPSGLKLEVMPPLDSTEKQVQDWIAGNKVAKEIIGRNVRTKTAQIKQEQERVTAMKVEEAVASVKAEQEKSFAEKVAGTTGNVTGEQLESAKAKAKEEEGKKWAAKNSLTTNRIAIANAKLAVVEKAAKETPERPVGEVWEIAKVARPPQPSAPAPASAPVPAVAQPPTTSTNSQPVPQQTTGSVQPTQTQTSQPSTVQSGPEHAQTKQAQTDTHTAPQSTGTAMPQANGTVTGFGQSAFGQPSFGQPTGQFGSFGRPSGVPLTGNASFQQAGQGPPLNRPGQMSNSMGTGFGAFGGLTQPGFGTQNPMPPNNARPNSPFNQQQPQSQSQQPQQGGRGVSRDSFGTGPAALRGLMGQQGNQSAIPRGGGIPRPGGRGGASQQTQNQNQNQNQGINIQGTGGSQIGRGGNNNAGGRGRGGRGGGNIQTNVPGGHSQSQGQNSPRATLNPGAQQFQPPSAGRGQKRDRDDGGGDDGGHRGGKRPFRGRGGGGGGEH